MGRVGRNIVIALLVILPFFLGWVTTMAVPAHRILPDTSAGNDVPVNTEASGTEPITLVLLGAGILNLAILGRNQCRKGKDISGKSV